MLDVSKLTKTYDGFNFGPVEFSVDNEVLAVLGPSGSGKSTLLLLIAGIVCPDTGSISLNNCPLIGQSPEERQIGLVFQDGALFPHMTARENIAYAADSHNHVQALAEMLEIEDALDRHPRALSGGEQQRVALARTLAADPDALLLDEPLSSLDVPVRRRLRNELHDLFQSLSIPTIYVTHDQRAAAALGDRIVIFRDGAVEQIGSPTDILERPETQFVARFSGAENIFDASVENYGGNNIRLRTGNVTLRANVEGDIGSNTTVCIHPSRIQLSSSRDEIKGFRENTFSGTIRQWLNEGDDYRIKVEVDDADISLTATVLPTPFKRLAVESGSSVQVSIPPNAIHLIR